MGLPNRNLDGPVWRGLGKSQYYWTIVSWRWNWFLNHEPKSSAHLSVLRQSYIHRQVQFYLIQVFCLRQGIFSSISFLWCLQGRPLGLPSTLTNLNLRFSPWNGFVNSLLPLYWCDRRDWIHGIQDLQAPNAWTNSFGLVAISCKISRLKSRRNVGKQLYAARINTRMNR